MNHRILKIFFFLFIALSSFAFYEVWTRYNYPYHFNYKVISVEHPEFIPTEKTVKAYSAWFENIVSDSYWISAIQYIWSNALWAQYKKFLFPIINLITDLNPYFTYPYEIWELLIPEYNERYENLSEADQMKYKKQWLAIGLKWIEKTCDKNKIELISKEYNLTKLWTDPKYKNPCIDSMIPSYLWYIYFWSLHDPENASLYYKITSANEDAVWWSKIMAAIMQWKSWDRQKSVIMLLSLAESVWSNNKQCNDFSSYIRDFLFKTYESSKDITPKILRDINDIRSKIDKDWALESEKTNPESDCQYYLNKAVREINLWYLENADWKYFKEKWLHAMDAKVLLDSGIIDYLPVDYQQEKDYWIIYYYNKDTKHWDAKMWKYWSEF